LTPTPEKPTASLTDASGIRENAFNPATMGDKCFYCGNQFGEATPRRVVTGKMGTMLLAHLACADNYERNGPPKPPDPPPSFGGKNIAFTTFAEMQRFISDRGPIPSTVRVTIGPLVLQEGDGAPKG